VLLESNLESTTVRRLLAALLLHFPRDPRWPRALLSEVDPERLFSVARANAVEGDVAATLLAGDLDVPEALLESARDARARCAAACGPWQYDLARLVRTLSPEQMILLKGAAMVARGDVDAWRRHADDIDVLVPEVDVEDVFDRLRRAGFRRDRHKDHRAIDGRTQSELLGDRHHEAVSMIGPGGTLVELHRHIPSRGGERSFTAVFPLTVQRETSLGLVRVPHRLALASMLSSHVFEHHLAEPIFLARHLADMRALRVDPRHLPLPLRRFTRDVARRFACAVAEFAHQGAYPPLAALFCPDGDSAARAWRFFNAVDRVARDLRIQPKVALRRAFPVRAYFDEAWGDDVADLPLRRLWMRRWIRIVISGQEHSKNDQA